MQILDRVGQVLHLLVKQCDQQRLWAVGLDLAGAGAQAQQAEISQLFIAQGDQTLGLEDEGHGFGVVAVFAL